MSYQEQLAQRDWILTTATVANVNENIESNGAQTNQHRILYDVDYQYDVNGKTYIGRIYRSVDKRVW